MPSVLLSAFADEGANTKTAIEQMTTLAALGLSYYSPRFIDVLGTGKVKHVTELDESELKQLAKMQGDYGVKVTSIGSRLGKVKLWDFKDASHNRYVDPKTYLETEVPATLNAAQALGAKLIRGFSFYHPLGESPTGYVAQAAERLGPIVEACAKVGCLFGLEVEPNLVGQNGRELANLAKAVGHPNLVCVYDAGNMACQNLSPETCFREYEAMRDSFGWMHIKDYKIDRSLQWTGVVDEERLKNFVPADVGDGGHEMILRDLREHIPAMEAKLKPLGVPGVFLEVEPHLKGGGQFGGFSGPDGLGVAVRALCRILDYVEINYHLRDFSDIRAARGF